MDETRQSLALPVGDEALEGKCEPLLSAQWGLQHAQLGSLFEAVMEMKDDLNSVKQSVVTQSKWKDMECMIDNMMTTLSEDREKSKCILQRVTTLEDAAVFNQASSQELVLNEPEQHRITLLVLEDSLTENKAELEKQKIAMELSFNHLDKQWIKLDSRLEQLEGKCGGDVQATNMAERLQVLADTLAAGNADLEKQKVATKTHLEYLEGLIVDSSTRYSDEFGSIQKSMEDLRTTIAEYIDSTNQSSSQQSGVHSASHSDVADLVSRFETLRTHFELRIGQLEEVQNSAAEKRDLEKHKSSTEARLAVLDGHLAAGKSELEKQKTGVKPHLEYLEGLVMDLTNQHMVEMDAIQQKLADIKNPTAESAVSPRNVDSGDQSCRSSLDNIDKKTKEDWGLRLESVESLLGDVKASMENRLDGILTAGEGELRKQEKAMEARFVYLEGLFKKHSGKAISEENVTSPRKPSEPQNEGKLEGLLEELCSSLSEYRKEHLDTLAKVDVEMQAMRVTWTTAHQTLTEDMRELMTRCKVATPVQLAEQMKKLREDLAFEVQDRSYAEKNLNSQVQNLSKWLRQWGNTGTRDSPSLPMLDFGDMESSPSMQSPRSLDDHLDELTKRCSQLEIGSMVGQALPLQSINEYPQNFSPRDTCYSPGGRTVVPVGRVSPRCLQQGFPIQLSRQ
jgi:hypothetical protein